MARQTTVWCELDGGRCGSHCGSLTLPHSLIQLRAATAAARPPAPVLGQGLCGGEAQIASFTA